MLKSLLTFLHLLLTAAQGISKYLEDKQVLDAGKALQLSQTLVEDKARVKKALQARRGVVVDADGNGLPDPDQDTRSS